MNKILVPTDFSDPSAWAVEVATDIALQSKTSIHLLHVIEGPPDQSFNTTGEWELTNGWEEKLFTVAIIKKSLKDLEIAAQQVEARGVKAEVSLRMGTPHEEINSIASDGSFGLIVMGTQSHDHLGRLLNGSNTEKAINNSRCPVLAVHEQPTAKAYKSIVYATNVSHEERSFSNVLKHVQKLYDSTIHLVRVNTKSNFMPDRQSRLQMQTFVKQLELTNYTINILNDETEEEGILYFADYINADLISIASHAHSGVVSLLTRGIARGVVNSSKRPVLTYLTD
ncbi:universal stress protein [Chryseolinea sp. T2]|uniref:universal stress protein n=1 Tax=Chryseolinea sp. T2 TaxID=3129255 RepID=UPI003077BA4B